MKIWILNWLLGNSRMKGSQKNQRPTCNHYGKISHTSNKCWSNGKEKFNGKCHKCKKQDHKASNCRTNSFNPIEKIMNVIFAWDYNTWCRYHYYGEYGHIGMNCVKCHTRKGDTTIRCYTCTKLGHLAKNCMNTGRVEDDKKAKADNIRK